MSASDSQSTPATETTETTATSSAYTKSSPNYDNYAQSYAEHFNRCTMMHAADLIYMTESKIQQSRRILDIGCGAGAFSLAYLQHFPNGING
jgi:2-polyprenyl-3-methyl-5-hydroxy-6-metoxy-1,4-benzoquinol methylase